MFNITSRRKSRWLIDPSNVAFGSVVQGGNRNLSRSHVRVRYRLEPDGQFVPLAAFIRRCTEAIRGGGALKIEHLLVAPVMKQRYPKFFDRLTDWGPAIRRAFGPSRESGKSTPLVCDDHADKEK